jgi:hypothetical protein
MFFELYERSMEFILKMGGVNETAPPNIVFSLSFRA